MTTDPMIKASKEPARNQYGQNGSPLAASLLPGESKSPIADASPPQCKVPGLDDQDQLAHRVRMDGDKAAEITPHSGMYRRSTRDGSPGGTIDGSHSRRR